MSNDDFEFEDDYDYDRAAPKKKRKIWLWFLIPALIVLPILAIIGYGALYVLTADTKPATEADRAVVIDGAMIADWTDGFDPQAEFEVFSRLTYLDGTKELEYEYDEELNDSAPWISCTVTYERRRADAVTSYEGAWLGIVGALKLSGEPVTCEDRSDLFRWGDRSRFGVLKHDGDPYGNLFSARKGKLVYFFMITGLYFDDAASIKELLEPVLNRAANYKIE